MNASKIVKKTVGKSLKDTVFSIIVIILIFWAFTQFAGTSDTSYKTEYLYIEQTGQLLQYKNDLSDLERVEVIGLADGDTIKVKRSDGTEAIIRYIGIDTPEIAHSDNENDDVFAREAMELNDWLLKNRVVYMKADATETDIYGRLLRYVYLEDGTMVNYVLGRLGYAKTLTIPPNVLYEQEFIFAQDKAQEEGLNLWAGK